LTDKSTKIVVTGVGIVSSIGMNLDETLDSIRSMKSGVGKINRLLTKHSSDLLAGEISQTNQELVELTGTSNKKGLTRTTLLGMVAAREALRDADVSGSEDKTGFISANTVGGMGHTELYYMDYLDRDKQGEFQEYLHTHNCGDSTERIADHLGINDFITTVNTACSSSANTIMLGARLIKNGLVDRVVAGGTDGLTKFTLNGFRSLMILDKDMCRPFDETRNGLNLGEGAGYVVLESAESAEARGVKIYSELSGYGNTCDAYHQTASSPEGHGAALAMKKAIKAAGLSTDDIDYINLHGTATLMNDLSEGNAVESVFTGEVPNSSSTKGYTGHTLGASGGIEAVFSNLAIKHQMVLPNINFSEQIKDLGFKPNAQLEENIEIKHVLSNSFGFGGNNTTLIFSKN